jgi:hypothetical protein
MKVDNFSFSSVCSTCSTTCEDIKSQGKINFEPFTFKKLFSRVLSKLLKK